MVHFLHRRHHWLGTEPVPKPAAGRSSTSRRASAAGTEMPTLSLSCPAYATQERHVTTIQTPEERLERVDQALDELKTAIVDAIQQLQRASEVDDSFDGRWQGVRSRITAIQHDVHPPDYDKD